MKIKDRKRTKTQKFLHYSLYALGLGVAFFSGYFSGNSLPSKFKNFGKIEYYINNPYEGARKIREKFEEDSLKNKKSIDSVFVE